MIVRRLLLGTLLVAALAACGPQQVGFDTGPRDATGTDGPRSDAPVSDGNAMDVVVTDSGPRCSAAQMICNDLCTNVMTDRNNCGACGNSCGEEMSCYSGQCHTSCPTGLTACTDPSGGAEQCVDIVNSRLNCGSCGHACPAASTCEGGICIVDCGTRTTCVPDADAGTPDGGRGEPYCADLTYDNGNCGACGHACPMDYICTSGTCVIDCVYPEVGCPPLPGMTDSYCVDTTMDANNCGVCGRTCPAGQTCRGGTCACNAPNIACGAACVDPTNDPSNCGACGRVCTPGVQTCDFGACATCAPRVFCSGVCTDTGTDPNNCGGCGTACPAGNACVAGVCTARPPAGVYMIPFAPEPTTGTRASLSDDSTTGLVPIGFSFRFFTNSYTQINISSNGFLSFDAAVGSGCCSGSPIPGADSINNIIAAAWTDLYPPGAGSVTYQTRGTAPTRRFVVSYTGVPWCCGTTAAVTTQVILFEGLNAIEIHTASQLAGHTYTQGVENATGTMAYFRAGRSSADYALTNDAVRFYTY